MILLLYTKTPGSTRGKFSGFHDAPLDQGQWVDIKEDGSVYVDGELLDEPYLEEKAFGDCDLELPYQVPDNRYFCMGDHRATSVDSRNTSTMRAATALRKTNTGAARKNTSTRRRARTRTAI